MKAKLTRRVHIKSNRFPCKCLDKDLHGSITQTNNEMEDRLLLDIVVCEGTSIFQLFSGKNKTLLVWWDTFVVLNFSLDILDRV